MDGSIGPGAAGAKPPQQQQPAEATASNPAASTASAGVGAGPNFGPAHRQSTFMRFVTAQLLQKLAVQPQAAAAMAGVSNKQCDAAATEHHHNTLDAPDTLSSTLNRPATGATAYSELSIYEDSDDQEPVHDSTDQHGDASEAAAGAVIFDDDLGSALQQWQDLQESLSRQQEGTASGTVEDTNSETAAWSEGPHATAEDPAKASAAGSSQSLHAAGSGVCETGTNSSSEGTRSSTAASSNSTATTISNSSSSHASGALGRAARDAGVLTPAQFKQALLLLSKKCFRRIANASRAWKLLIDRHVQPLADRKRNR